MNTWPVSCVLYFMIWNLQTSQNSSFSNFFSQKDNTAEPLQGGAEQNDTKVDASTKAGQNDTKVEASTKVSTKKEKNNNCALENKNNENTCDDKIYETEPRTRPQKKIDNEKKPNESTNACPPESGNRLVQKDTKKEDEKGSKNTTNKAQKNENSKNNNEGAKVSYYRTV